MAKLKHIVLDKRMSDVCQTMLAHFARALQPLFPFLNKPYRPLNSADFSFKILVGVQDCIFDITVTACLTLVKSSKGLCIGNFEGQFDFFKLVSVPRSLVTKSHL